MGRMDDDKAGATVWLGQALLGRLDEARARRLRARLGRSRWIVSWLALPRGGWLARLSGPGQSETIEGPGRTRVEAIRRAARVARASWAAEASMS